MMYRHFITSFLLPALASVALATETENLGIAVLPAPGKVVVDGKCDDWDLSGGIFICGDVENMRDKFAVWFHAMHDAENLYLLARWTDETPLNNPGQIAGSYGFAGDCLQVRVVTAPGKPQEFGNHFTCWRDRNGEDTIFVEVGKDFKGGTIKDAKTRGAKQAFTKNADGKGYVQEIALPWKLLTKDGQAPKPGETIIITVEPNFTIGQSGRLTLKDLFKPGVTPDRVFTFMSSNCWGPATLERQGKIQPRSLRLADAREFKVRMNEGRSGGRLDGTHQDRGASRLQAGQVHHARGRLHLAANPRRRGPGRLPALEPGVDDQGRTRGAMGRPDDVQLSHTGPDRAAGQLLVARDLAQGHRTPPARLGLQRRQRPVGFRPDGKLGW